MERLFSLVIWSLFVVFPLYLWANTEAPQVFTYEGRLYDSSDNPLSETVTFKLQILNQAENCLLYEETQVKDLSASEGRFALEVGSATGASKRSTDDPGFAMWQVFKNTGSLAVPVAVCPGTPYNPSLGEKRKLRVSVTPTSTSVTEVLSPSQTITSAPSSMMSQSLQGVGKDGFIQVVGSVTQADVESLLDGSDIGSSLHNHDSIYAKVSGSGSMTFGAGSTLGLGTFDNTQETALTGGLVAGDAGKTWYNSDTGLIMYWDGDSVEAVGTSSGGITSLNGHTGSSQTFTTPGTTGTAPNWDFATANQHKLNIPLASTATVVAGLLSNTDYAAFSSKLSDASVPNAAGDIAGNFNAGLTIQNDSVTSSMILDGQVDTADLASSVVTTAKIADSNVTTAKLADGSVSLPKLDAAGATALQAIRRNSGNTAWEYYTPATGDVSSSRSLTAGAGLTGGGDLSADRTFNVGAGTGISVAADSVAVDITGTTAETTADNADEILIYDSSATALRKMTRSNFLSGLGTGTLSNVVEDTTPQLGGNLDVNGKTITSAGAMGFTTGAGAGNDFTINTDKFVVEGDTGKVGIGTATPGQKLEIDGNIGFTTADSNAGLSILGGASDGYLRIGVNSPNHLGEGDMAAQGSFISFDSRNAQGAMEFWSKQQGASTIHRAMVISHDGKVGVGTAAPNAKLTVEGAMTLDQLAADPTGTAGYGSLYTKADGKLYYRNGTGTVTDIIAGATGGTITALTGDVTASGIGSVAATVATVGGVTAANVASGANLANAATSANTASTIVKRDASGNFSAGTITANLTGNVTGNLTGNVTGNVSGTAANVTGTVAIANGGTGQTTATAAFNALAPTQTGNSGKFLTTNGTTTSWATVAGDNLGSHIATSNIILGSNYLSGDGGNEGISVDSSGNVGIGTTNPLVNLHVSATDSGANIRVENTASTAPRYPSSDVTNYTGGFGGYPYFKLENNRGSKGSRQAIQTGDPLGMIQFYGAKDTSTTSRGAIIEAFAQENFSGTSAKTGLRILTNPTGSTDATPYERMRITGDGNVGIGTITPGTRLEVAGQVKITGGAPGAGKVLTSDAAGLATWQALPGGGDLVSTNNLSDLANAATARTNLGLAIGTNVQAYDADLDDLADGTLTATKVQNGSFFIDSAGTAGQVWTSDGVGAGGWTTPTNANTASTIVKRDASGNFSAGTITANLTGNVTGNLIGNVTGNVSGTAANVTGTVAIANGGTGQTTASAAFNALAPSQVTNSGKYLTTDGTTTSWATVAGDNLGSHEATQNIDLNTFKLVGNNGTEGISIGSDGKIGIGTTTPSSKLTIIGGGTSNYRGIEVKNTGDDATSKGSVAIVGARKTNASAPFSGFGTWDNGSARSLYIGGGGWQMPDANSIRFYTASTYDETIDQALERMTIAAGGNVGIGTTTPSEKLEVSGNVKATSFLVSSDENLKYDIKEIKAAVATIMKLRGVTFRWMASDKEDIGFIAQQIEQVLPELVHTDQHTGLKSVQYANIVAVLVAAIQEQQVALKKERDINLEQEKRLNQQAEQIESILEKLESK